MGVDLERLTWSVAEIIAEVRALRDGIAQAADELAVVNRRVDELEKAGDAMADHFGQTCGCLACVITLKAWRALRSKPATEGEDQP